MVVFVGLSTEQVCGLHTCVHLRISCRVVQIGTFAIHMTIYIKYNAEGLCGLLPQELMLDAHETVFLRHSDGFA